VSVYFISKSNLEISIHRINWQNFVQIKLQSFYLKVFIISSSLETGYVFVNRGLLLSTYPYTNLWRTYYFIGNVWQKRESLIYELLAIILPSRLLSKYAQIILRKPILSCNYHNFEYYRASVFYLKIGPETETSSFYWAHLSRFHLTTETEFSPRNVVFFK
jgi:hypothetical protein